MTDPEPNQMPGRQGSPNPTLRQMLILIIVTILVTLGLIEGVARAAGIRPTENNMLADARLGWRWTPGFEGDIYTNNGDLYTISISERGLRDRSYAVPRPAGITRVLVLGDSVALGMGVNIDEAFPRQLEEMLTTQGQPVEVMNGGTLSYNTEQAYLWLRYFGMRLEPQHVILVYVTNDPRDEIGKPNPAAPLYNFLQRRSAAYGWYLGVRVQAAAKNAATSPEGRFRYVDEYWAFDWKDDPDALARLFAEADQSWGIGWNPEALETNLASLDVLADYVDAQGMTFTLVLAPTHAQVAAQAVPDGFDLDYPQDTVTAWAESRGVAVIDPLAEFRAYPDPDALFIDFVHLTAEGNRLLAEVVEREMEH